MGRLTNAVGIRLGNSHNWYIRNYGAGDLRDTAIYAMVKHYIKNISFKDKNYVKSSRSVLYGKPKIVHTFNKATISFEIYTLWHTLEPIHLYKFNYIAGLIQKKSQRILGKQVIVHFLFVNYKASGYVPAEAVLQYALTKLKKGFTVGNILSTGLAAIRAQRRILGFRLEFRGRFTRRQRAFIKKAQGGRLPLSSFSANIQYAQGSVVTKYGVGGVKIWLHYRNTGAKYSYIITKS